MAPWTAEGCSESATAGITSASCPQLTADQNLTFIEPFCRTAARTKE